MATAVGMAVGTPKLVTEILIKNQVTIMKKKDKGKGSTK